MNSRACAIGLTLLAAACGSGGDPAPGDVPRYDGIGEGETINLLGTEPFWGMRIFGEQVVYSTPSNIDGISIPVTRFAGNGGLGFHGELDGQTVNIAVTPGDCSDQMSDRIYPFTATARIGDTELAGCGYSDNQPFSGDEAP